MRTTIAFFPVALLAFGAVACRSGATDTSAPSASAPSSTAAHAAIAPNAKAELGQAAPDFELSDLDGKIVHLKDFAGKIVVLEWFNPDCPFVKRNHTTGPLKTMAKDQMAKGIVWLSINSGASGKQGAGVDNSRAGKQRYGMENPILIDGDGAVGRAYGARTTPHMYVVDTKGMLVYRGAIDNAQDGDPPGGEKFVNYVDVALGEIAAGKPVTTAETKSYGCSVKYGSNS
jgi:peroxiredoxin